MRLNLVQQIYVLWLYGARFKIFGQNTHKNMYLVKFRVPAPDNDTWSNVGWLKPQ